MNQRRFVVSFHDLTPQSRPVCSEILTQLKERGVERTSLLVTPCWHGEDSIDRFPDFLDWLHRAQSEGHEICLHGYTHRAESIAGGPIAQAIGRFYTAREGEFYQIGREEARQRIRSGLNMLRDAGLDICGFVPPAWLLSEAGRQALKEEGLLYITELQHIDFLQARRLYAPVLVFSCRSGWRRWTSIRWVQLWERLNRRTPILRLAIHPVDWDFPAIRETILDLADRLRPRRIPVAYRDLATSFEKGGKERQAQTLEPIDKE